MARLPRRPGRTNELRVGTEFRFDAGRSRRIGAPEVVLGEGKTSAQLLRLLNALHHAGRGALVSRPTAAQRKGLSAARRSGLPVVLLAGGRVARLEGPISDSLDRGPVALLAAGTSDAPIAEEARHLLESVGVEVLTAYDVGVAGLHRLQRALRTIERKEPRVYLVFAGREGALPTVVAGLVPAPVVGVPVSTGYGRGGRGEAALTAMLQSCAPIAVVNIDGGVPAALFALQVLAGKRRGRGSRVR
ncbi:MAG: nickel pincer cofactor biosynthesis protein LarB [Thermoplasmata archaeon]